jgi:hypothetical protein
MTLNEISLPMPFPLFVEAVLPHLPPAKAAALERLAASVSRFGEATYVLQDEVDLIEHCKSVLDQLGF